MQFVSPGSFALVENKKGKIKLPCEHKMNFQIER